jgi:hypothetical protein
MPTQDLERVRVGLDPPYMRTPDRITPIAVDQLHLPTSDGRVNGDLPAPFNEIV